MSIVNPIVILQPVFQSRSISDGKLSLSYEVGGNFPELIGEDVAQQLIDYTDQIYLDVPILM